MFRHVLLVTLITVVVAQAGLFAQDEAGRPGVCFRGRPSPHCRVFMLTEFRLYPGETYGWGGGGMVNISSRFALGATANLDEDPGGWVFRPRARVWVVDPIYVDVTVFSRLNNEFVSEPTTGNVSQIVRRRVIPEVALGIGDWIALAVQTHYSYFWTYERGYTHDTNWIVGLRFGSALGIVTGLSAFVLGLVYSLD